MPLSESGLDMARAAIAGEDLRFCSHNGFDFKAIAGAAARNARGGRRTAVASIDQPADREERILFQGGGYVRKAFEAHCAD